MDFDYNEDKDKLLRKIRGIGFKEIADSINKNGVFTDFKHFNTVKYPKQRIFVVKIKNKLYFVPYVFDIERNFYFLKTLYPSSKLTKKFIKK